MPLRAKDIMKTGIRTVQADVTLADLERMLLEAHIGGMPVVSEGRVVGVISRSDVVKQLSVGRTLADHAVLDYYQDISGFSDSGTTAAAEAETARRQEAVGNRLMGVRVRDAMVEDVVSVEPGARVTEVARLMVDHGIHRVLVIEDGTLQGLITSLDIVQLIARDKSV